jgi:hypothetical protein
MNNSSGKDHNTIVGGDDSVGDSRINIEPVGV